MRMPENQPRDKAEKKLVYWWVSAFDWLHAVIGTECTIRGNKKDGALSILP